MNAAYLSRGRQAGRLSFWAMAGVALLPSLLPGWLLAQQDERSVRAAFVYNMTKYVVWPVPARDLKICVLGGRSMGSVLKLVIDGKTSGQRAIRVLLEPPETDFRHCDILYWSNASGSRASSMLDKTRGTSILTVGEDDSFVREGGMIGFIRSGDSIQIEVNLDSVKAGGLKISSRLLDLAVIVHSRQTRLR